MKETLGAILAGGRSRRFGSDKALATYAGRSLIAHVIAALRPQCAALIVCGRSGIDLGSTDSSGSTEAISDRPGPDLGPLGGLNAALHHARSRGFSHVLSVGCDTPRLPPELLRQLSAPHPTFVRDLPIIGLWPVALADTLERHLSTAGDRSIGRWARSVGAEPVNLAEVIPNINTTADLLGLETAERMTADCRTGDLTVCG